MSPIASTVAPVESRKHEKYDRLLAAAKELPPLRTAVAHPCDQASLGAVVEAASLGIIEPILVGPLDRIAAASGLIALSSASGPSSSPPVICPRSAILHKAAASRVAILSAMETVNPKVPSTIEAAALCKMADRGQITGAVLDGPLALDNAIDLGAAKIKNIASPVAGQANILVVPDLEAGNMLAKSLTFLADADAAGIVLGARVPIILTSRADSQITRLASCAVASLVADAQRSKLAVAEV